MGVMGVGVLVGGGWESGGEAEAGRLSAKVREWRRAGLFLRVIVAQEVSGGD
jgi:hypothetical protein